MTAVALREPAVAAYGARSLAVNAISVDAPEGLHLIRRDRLNLVIWDRRRTPDVWSLAGQIPDGLQIDPEAPKPLVRADRIEQDCAEFIARLFGHAPPAALALGADMTRLARFFIGVTQALGATIHLERLSHDGCRFFHTDLVGIRLLCSYMGPGTQWLDDDLVDRTVLGSKSNARICKSERGVHELSRGAVGLFKGGAWPGNAGKGVVHRSPPIIGSGQQRLLLRLDVAGHAPALHDTRGC